MAFLAYRITGVGRGQGSRRAVLVASGDGRGTNHNENPLSEI